MTETTTFEGQKPAGLFPLHLIAEGGMPGAPTAKLYLGVYTPQKTVSGLVEITQALLDPVVCTSHVSGVYFYEAVMGAEPKIRIDLEGYPAIIPPNSDIVLPENFKATIVLDDNWQNGTIIYEYRTNDGRWVNPGPKQIHIVTETEAAQVAAE